MTQQTTPDPATRAAHTIAARSTYEWCEHDAPVLSDEEMAAIIRAEYADAAGQDPFVRYRSQVREAMRKLRDACYEDSPTPFIAIRDAILDVDEAERDLDAKVPPGPETKRDDPRLDGIRIGIAVAREAVARMLPKSWSDVWIERHDESVVSECLARIDEIDAEDVAHTTVPERIDELSAETQAEGRQASE